MVDKTSDLQRSIAKWKTGNPDLSIHFDDGYEAFKVGIMLRQAREAAGLTQCDLAQIIGTKRTAISRLENHAEDVKLSTLEKVARALGKHLELHLA